MSKPRLSVILTLAVVLAACGDAPPNASPADTRAATDTTATLADPGAGTMAPPVDTGTAAGSADTAAPPAPTPVEAMRGRGTGSEPAVRPAQSADPVEPDEIRAATDSPGATPVGDLQQDPARLLRRTAGIYAAMNAMKAEFSMLTRNPLLQTRASSRGTLYQRRPDRIKLDFTDPAGDVIVGDGTWFWVFYPSVDAKQVIRTPAAGTAGVVDLQAQFVGDPLKRFDHTVEGRETVNGRDATIISLVPRENLGYARLKVWIDDADFLVRRFEIMDPNGVTRLLDLTGLVLDPALPDDLFQFTPPAGARVVERE